MNSPTISRLDQGGIGRLVGASAAKQLLGRLRGGQSGLKGLRYEEVFGAHRIARLARKLLSDGDNASVEWQSDGFVDDFVVRRNELLSIKGYQLKNSPNVSWTTGSPTIEDDFKRQRIVSDVEGYKDIRLRLVCSNEETAGKLAEDVPASVSSFSRAFFFPYAPLPIALDKFSWFADDFAFLSNMNSQRKLTPKKWPAY